MTFTEAERAGSQKAASRRYNARNRQTRNEKTRARMAKLRAAEAGLPAEAQEARKQAKLASARRYREKNRARLAEEAAWYRGRAAAERKSAATRKRVAELKESRRARIAAKTRGDDTGGDGNSLALDQRCLPLNKPLGLTTIFTPPHAHLPRRFTPGRLCTVHDPGPPRRELQQPHRFHSAGEQTILGPVLAQNASGDGLKLSISFRTDVLIAAQEAGAAAARPRVLESYNGWRQVWAAWAQHCWVRHTRCSMHPNACCDGQCPDHPPPTNPEAIKVAKRGSVKQEGGGEPAKRIKSEAPSSSAPRRRAVRRHPPAVTISDDDDTPKAPLYDPDTPPERNRRHGQVDEVTPASPSPAAVGGGIRRIEDTRAAHVSRGPSLASAVPSSSASAVPSSATPSSVSSLSASTAAPSIMGALAVAPSTVGASAAVAGLASGPDASWMHGLNDRALRVALHNDPFFVGTRGKIFHSRDQAFDEVSEGPVQVVVGWEAATELAVELVRERAAKKGKEKEKGASMDVDGA
ncbi:hypothetical protein C8F04DRAFT_1192262 [Mycena alexandri]|uniref:Uncharacterized protein n=1 Tax=Mycena alexandri TaxID=1745969 RepID=A0AAD6WTC0_9AGAR|nr:hypothetical protein C8F04DRAFT_1192262 [Mycena alexandri]